jgi:hypothetical protein
MDRPRTERLDMVIDLAIPWYIRFTADWSVAEAEAGRDCLWLRYEDLIADGADVVGRVLNFHGLNADPATIEAALAQARDGDSRFNKGVAGRGNELTAAQKNRIMDLTRHYPGIDFSALGLA